MRGLSGAAGDATASADAGAASEVEPYPFNRGFSTPPRSPPRIGTISAFRRFSSSIAAASTSSSYSESSVSSESSDDDAGFEPSDSSSDSSSDVSSSDVSSGTQLSNFAIFGDSRKNGTSPSLTSSVSRSDGGLFGSKGCTNGWVDDDAVSTVSSAPLRSTANADLRERGGSVGFESPSLLPWAPSTRALTRRSSSLDPVAP